MINWGFQSASHSGVKSNGTLDIAAVQQRLELEAELADCDKAWRGCGDRAEKAEKRVRELEKVKNAYDELFRDSQRGIIEVVEDALGREMISDAYTAVHRLANAYKELRAKIAELESAEKRQCMVGGHPPDCKGPN